ncbi:secreted RxLR effector protein 161-like [Lycium ferocissimum]|uniref:secreted RxLR effector protein 161-like n=1 Tax=Lycium ferocissimum TaxID=112874 RepID=UPI0028154F9B|nr:secreted RxLR effector protein 161-like [Lycium ferocissimum]
MGLRGTKSTSTPMKLNLKLTTIEYARLLKTIDDPRKTYDPLLDGIPSYQQLVGKLIYLATRLNICFAVQVRNQFMQCPKRSHWEAAMRVLRYLKKSPGRGILLKRSCINSLTVFCDANWASCPNTKRSITGYVVQLGGSLISWKSRSKDTVSRSSTKAEYRNVAAAVAEVN